MAHTNQTPNYALSEFIGTDKPAWLVDYNGDMEKIDLAMKAISDVATAAKTKADNVETDLVLTTATANDAQAKATEALSNMADTYDATATYALGDLVLYQGVFYVCTTAIIVPEAFNGDHWHRTTIEEIRNALELKIGNLETVVAQKDVYETLSISIPTLDTGIHGRAISITPKSGYNLVGVQLITAAHGSTCLYATQVTNNSTLYVTSNSAYAETSPSALTYIAHYVKI